MANDAVKIRLLLTAFKQNCACINKISLTAIFKGGTTAHMKFECIWYALSHMYWSCFSSELYSDFALRSVYTKFTSSSEKHNSYSNFRLCQIFQL